jgi:hypothetical protein
MLMVPEPRHSYLRKLVMPAFTNEAIEKLIPRMEAVLRKHLDSWAGGRALGAARRAFRISRGAEGVVRMLFRAGRLHSPTIAFLDRL